MINVTVAAASKISELLVEENKPDAGLRVFVQGGGCSGFQYGLMIDEGEGDASTDSVIEVNGVKLMVDPISARYNLASLYGAYDPQVSFSGVHNYDASPGGIDDL